jgi:uncharacterized protein YjiS (DUF1127 family)
LTPTLLTKTVTGSQPADRTCQEWRIVWVSSNRRSSDANPKSGTFDIDGMSPFVSPRLAARTQASRIGKAICVLMTRFLAWRARKVTLRLLSSLDGATLRDLGLTDIESEVYGDPADRRRGYDNDWWRRRHR